jgi:hypothetical protein
MNKLMFVLALTVANTAPVAHASPCPNNLPDHGSVAVNVSPQGDVTVGEEPIHTYQSEGGLVWHIALPGFHFADNGIDVDSHGKHCCYVPPSGSGSFRCDKNKNGFDPKDPPYKYTVTVIDESKGRALTPIDPFIQNH